MPTFIQKISNFFNKANFWSKNTPQVQGDIEENINNLDENPIQLDAMNDEIELDLTADQSETSEPAPSASTWSSVANFVSFICSRENLPTITGAQLLNLTHVGANILGSILFAKTTEAAFNEKKSTEIGGAEVSLQVLVSMLTTAYALSFVARAQAQKILARTKADTYARAVDKSTQITDKHPDVPLTLDDTEHPAVEFDNLSFTYPAIPGQSEALHVFSGLSFQ
ncbi:MAG: hypothetical protein P4L79_17325 [Legionella sp.]|uniref:hypothetical protein n=1 Tax=Legionella sp. TaxID=459 RepID=UPI002840BC5E|nr:hypothetical protein [Legionella sp.]